MSDNLFQERLRELEEAKKHSVPDTEREKDLAAAAHPKDKITHKDVLVKRGVVEGSETAADIDKKIEFHRQGQAAAQYKGAMNKMHAAKIRELVAKKQALKQGVLKAEGVDIEEKSLTPAELKKREEVAKAMERDKPGMNKSKKMAIATAVAKRVAESIIVTTEIMSEETAHSKGIKVGHYIKTAAGVEGVVKHITPDGKKITIWNRSRQADHRVVASKAERIKGIARRKVTEDIIQINELSKTTLAAYYAKSIKDRHSKDLARDSAKRKGDEKEADVLGREVTNRSSGLEKAKAKFFKEDSDNTTN